ncbi:elongator complex protein 6-like [Hydra vulgaris]|uniref:Elongator complex protein 6 n=1 Tax=Hydra vulgaris TaxID=6087 RepID=A0ABM4CT46_HYDVU
MYSNLNYYLGLSESLQCEFITIADSNIDGNFLIHHFISSVLKNGGKVCLFGFAQTLTHYSNACQKLGVNLQTYADEGSFAFVDILKSICDSFLENDTLFYDNSSPGYSLKGLWEVIQKKISNRSLLILDDITSLVNIGVSAQVVADFLHYCKVATHKQCVSFVILGHCNEDDTVCSRVQAFMKTYSTLAIHVSSLKTGYSSDVSGEILIYKKKKTNRMHFKLADKDVKLFPVGTCPAVL